MRSLWKDLALRWLGGEASAALAGDSPLRERLLPKTRAPAADAFRISRQPAVSDPPSATPGAGAQATIPADDPAPADPE